MWKYGHLLLKYLVIVVSLLRTVLLFQLLIELGRKDEALEMLISYRDRAPHRVSACRYACGGRGDHSRVWGRGTSECGV